jgi:transposase-like protein
MKNGETFNLNDLAQHFHDAESAREFLEKSRWPEGPVCPHCGEINNAFRLEPKPSKKGKHVRKGVWKCGGCREQFTVTVGTIFEDSHIPLNKWLLAIHLLCASKKGMSAHQLHRMLGVTYKSAWFMAHRIRYAMSQPPLATKLKGIVEADETYVGAKRKRGAKRGRPGIDSHKVPVIAVLERGGRVRSQAVERVTAENLRQAIRDNCETDAHIMTDDLNLYRGIRKEFPKHSVVNHSAGEYARGEVHVNSLEGFFGLLKRGITGVYHHVGKGHLHRYLSEFDFRYNSRTLKDGERTMLALKGTEGKRLMLREPSVSEAI